MPIGIFFFRYPRPSPSRQLHLDVSGNNLGTEAGRALAMLLLCPNAGGLARSVSRVNFVLRCNPRLRLLLLPRLTRALTLLVDKPCQVSCEGPRQPDVHHGDHWM